MANDFSRDPTCIAVWRFEPSALTTDSKGANTLTALNTPTEAGDYKEGSGAADLESTSSQAFKIADANLDAGFPLKTGDTSRLFTLACWVKPESFGAGNRTILSKWKSASGKRHVSLEVTSAGVVQAVSSDGSNTYYIQQIAMTAGQWYHISWVRDYKYNYGRLIVYNATTGQVSSTWGNDLYYNCTPSDAPFNIGCRMSSGDAVEQPFDGIIDEVVVWNRLVSPGELDAVRRGVYPAPVDQVAHWQFEDSPGFLVDTVNALTLSNVNSVTQDKTNYHEGAASAAFVKTSSKYLEITDANLPNNFPLKSGGDGSRQVTWFARLKPHGLSNSVNQAVFSKWGTVVADQQLCFGWYGSYLRFYYGYTSAQTSFTAEPFYNVFFNDEWIAVAITYDCTAKLAAIHVYQYSTGHYWVTYAGINATYVLNIAGTSPFMIGGQVGSNYWDGKIDDVRVFKRCVTEQEFLQLAKGLYNDDSPNRSNVVAMGLVVAYKEPLAGWFTHFGNIPLACVVTSGAGGPVFAHLGSVTALVTPAGEYIYQGPNQKVHLGSIPITVVPSALSFNCFAHKGSIAVIVTPQGEGFTSIFHHAGNIEVTITPMGVSRVPVAGWDIPSGYGLVDFTDLGDPPPYWCLDTPGLTVSLGPEAVIVFYAEHLYETSGELQASGQFTYADFYPDETRLSTNIEAVASGSLSPVFVEPRVTLHTLQLQAEVWGAFTFAFVGAKEIPVSTITTSRGVKAAGAFVFELVGVDELEILHTTITLAGGVTVGEVRRPPIVVVDPGLSADETVLEFEARGTIFAGGSLTFDIPVPGVYEFETTRAGVVVGGGFVFGFWEPPSIEIELFGGVFVEGVALADEAARFETWVLNGFYFEPSIYGNFPFNSYATKDGKCYGAGEDGIYLLEGGDDAGRPIHPGVRVGPTNFGFASHKRLRAIYPGKKSGTPDLRVKGNNGEESFCKLDDRNRFSVSQKVQDEVLTMEISDFTELSHIEFVPIIKMKR